MLLGVKPYGIVELAREISPALAPDALVISVAAGVTLDTLTEGLFLRAAGDPLHAQYALESVGKASTGDLCE